MYAPQTSLKVIVIAHFILTVWASMISGFLPTSYIYMNAFVLAFGFWAIVSPESVDSILMFLVLNLISILLDIIFLGIYTPRAHNTYEGGLGKAYVDEYRFCLGMAITNLLIKPFSSFVLYRLYQDRGGSYSDFGIPGMPNFGPSGGRQGNYENIDQSVPSHNVETAVPHQTLDKSTLP